ncbi:hypothetical protein [Maribacter sp. 2-571]
MYLLSSPIDTLDWEQVKSYPLLYDFFRKPRNTALLKKVLSGE